MLMEECKELTQRLEQLRESQRQVTASNRTEMDRIMIIMEESLKAEINWAEERIKAKRKLVIVYTKMELIILRISSSNPYPPIARYTFITH
mmetsp:Transcript_29794/g.40910  ORF Transcript_29794/g.40910 Transcript_29794/m.40910 type:complete len:91 (+) Transcript_29794:549-821(+)